MLKALKLLARIPFDGVALAADSGAFGGFGGEPGARVPDLKAEAAAQLDQLKYQALAEAGRGIADRALGLF